MKFCEVGQEIGNDDEAAPVSVPPRVGNFRYYSSLRNRKGQSREYGGESRIATTLQLNQPVRRMTAVASSPVSFATNRTRNTSDVSPYPLSICIVRSVNISGGILARISVGRIPLPRSRLAILWGIVALSTNTFLKDLASRSRTWAERMTLPANLTEGGRDSRVASDNSCLTVSTSTSLTMVGKSEVSTAVWNALA